MQAFKQLLGLLILRASWEKAWCSGAQTEWSSFGLDCVHSVLLGTATIGGRQAVALLEGLYEGGHISREWEPCIHHIQVFSTTERRLFNLVAEYTSLSPFY